MTTAIQVGRKYTLDDHDGVYIVTGTHPMVTLVNEETRQMVQIYNVNHAMRTMTPYSGQSATMTTLRKLTAFAKRHLDKDVQAFVRLGLMNDSLEVTEQGRRYLDAFLYNQFKKELGEAARADITEQESDE